MSVLIDFIDSDVETTQRSIFQEVVVPVGEDEVEIDVASGGVRFAGVAFGPDFDDDGAPIAGIDGWIPWRSGGVWAPINTMTLFDVQDGETLAVPYADSYPYDKIRLRFTTPQSTETKIGIFGWTG